MDEELDRRIATLAKRRHESRAACIRHACEHYLRNIEREELERLYEEGYRRVPERPHPSKALTRIAAAVLVREKWE